MRRRAIRRKVSGPHSCQVAKRGKIGAEDGQATEASLEDGNAKSFFTAGKKKGICQAIELSNFGVGQAVGAQLGEKVSRAIQLKLGAQGLQAAQVGTVGGVVRPRRPGNHQLSSGQSLAKLLEGAESQLQVLTGGQANWSKQQRGSSCQAQTGGYLSRGGAQAKEPGGVEARRDHRDLIRRQIEEAGELFAARLRYYHLAGSRPGAAEQVPGIAGVEIGAVTGGGPGQVVMPEDQARRTRCLRKVVKGSGEGQVLVQ